MRTPERHANEICGNCKFFDPNTVSKNPVGIIQLPSGEIIKKGYCRAFKGLVWVGEADEKSSCRHPYRPFTPKESK